MTLRAFCDWCDTRLPDEQAHRLTHSGYVAVSRDADITRRCHVCNTCMSEVERVADERRALGNPHQWEAP